MTNDPMRQEIAALLRPGRDGGSAEHSLDAQKGTIAQDSATKPTRAPTARVQPRNRRLHARGVVSFPLRTSHGRGV